MAHPVEKSLFFFKFQEVVLFLNGKEQQKCLWDSLETTNLGQNYIYKNSYLTFYVFFILTKHL